MTKQDIQKKVNEYNMNRAAMTADKVGKLYKDIEQDCKTLTNENHKEALVALASSGTKAEILLAFITGYTYTKVSVKADKDTGSLSLKDGASELEWASLDKQYADTHENESLAHEPTFATEARGLFGKLIKNAAILQADGVKKGTIIRRKTAGGDTADEIVTPDKKMIEAAYNKTHLMKCLEVVWRSLLPDEIYVKPIKADLNRMIDAVMMTKGRKQLVAKETTLMVQLIECIRTRRENDAYIIESKI